MLEIALDGRRGRLDGRPRPAGRGGRSHRRGDPGGLSRSRHPLPRALAALRRGGAPAAAGRSRRSAPGRRSTSSSSRSCSTPARARAGASPIRSSGETFTRSEGLAVASQRLVETGALGTGGDALAALDGEVLAIGFQASGANPLAGLEGRTALLRRLGAQVLARPDLFASADSPRPGGLYDVLAARAAGGQASRAGDTRAAARGAGADLGGPARPGRSAARRLLEASRDPARRLERRARAAPQIVAMAGLFADRAARGIGHRGGRRRRPHRPRRISQRRAVRGHRSAQAHRPGRRLPASSGVGSADRRLALDDGGAARPAGAAGPANGWA